MLNHEYPTWQFHHNCEDVINMLSVNAHLERKIFRLLNTRRWRVVVFFDIFRLTILLKQIKEFINSEPLVILTVCLVRLISLR